MPSKLGNALRKPPKRAAASGGEAKTDHTLLGYNAMAPYLFSGPAVALVGLILAFPVLYSLYQSLFAREALGQPVRFVGFANYLELLRDGGFWSALARSGVFILGCLVIGQVLAVVFAFALNRAVQRLRFLRGLSILPYIVSSVAGAVMFRILFNRDIGLPNQILELVGLAGPSWLTQPALAMVVVIIAQVWSDLPLSILVILGGLQTIDGQLLDAALVDGANGLTRARYVTLPLIAPQLALSTIWFSYSCLTSLGVILALTGGGPGTATQTLPMQMYSTAFDRFDTYSALAIANVILLLNAALTVFYLRLARRFRVD